MSELMKIPGVGLAMATRLRELGIQSLEDLAQSDISVLTTIRGISESKAQDFKSAASGDLTGTSETPTAETPKAKKKASKAAKKAAEKAAEAARKAAKKIARKAEKAAKKEATKAKKDTEKAEKAAAKLLKKARKDKEAEEKAAEKARKKAEKALIAAQVPDGSKDTPAAMKSKKAKK